MKQTATYHFLLTVGLILSLASCNTSHPDGYYRTLAHAGLRLGLDIDRNDNHKLYLNAAEWIDTPYRSGGDSREGIDCSGLTHQLYRTVYHIRLPRNASAQHNLCPHLLTRDELRPGDLLFFTTTSSGRKIAHIGIYLKEWKFIHASSQGVMVSSLLEEYYRQHWVGGGRFDRN